MTNNPTIFDRLRRMETRKGQSLSELEHEACDVAEQLRAALAKVVHHALDYFSVEGEEGEAIDEANAALIAAGDPDALAAQREWEELTAMGLGDRS